jgi:anti-sigma factor ChrR (cupin superfamily)
MAGVSRRPLDRVGDEVARASTIVRYAPNSHFSPHVHTGGEEFIVLSGTFQDEHGDFPTGSYIRNPPQSKHQPGSADGCVIFVKLWQLEPDDRTHVRLNTQFMQAVPHRDLAGISVTPLYHDDAEQVTLIDWEPNAKLTIDAVRGAELLVIEGELTEGDDTLVKHSWLRTPIGSSIQLRAGAKGAKAWVKQGHLNRVEQEIKRVADAGKKSAT